MIRVTRNEMMYEIDWLVSSMKTAQAGTINLNVGSQQAVKIHITDNGNKIMVDLLEPELFSASHDETSLWDKLKSAKEFARKLADNRYDNFIP